MNGWESAGLNQEYDEPEAGQEPSHLRTLVKCAWRCSRVARPGMTVEALVSATQNIRRTFGLSRREHKLVCAEALRRGERLLAADVFELEMHGGAAQPDAHFTASGSSPGDER